MAEGRLDYEDEMVARAIAADASDGMTDGRKLTKELLAEIDRLRECVRELERLCRELVGDPSQPSDAQKVIAALREQLQEKEQAVAEQSQFYAQKMLEKERQLREVSAQSQNHAIDAGEALGQNKRLREELAEAQRQLSRL